MAKQPEDRVNPIKITPAGSDKTYELDFDKESVRYMARQKFIVGENIGSFIAEDGPTFFYYAFRKNHRNVSRQKTDDILENVLRGLTPKILERLIELYYQALQSNNVIQSDEDLEKNGDVTVEM